MNITELLDGLTLEQAYAWDMSSEKTLFVDDEICGPANVYMSDAVQNLIEERFMELLKNDAEQWDAEMAQMKAAEDRWVDAGCPTNGSIDNSYMNNVNWVGHPIHY